MSCIVSLPVYVCPSANKNNNPLFYRFIHCVPDNLGNEMCIKWQSMEIRFSLRMWEIDMFFYVSIYLVIFEWAFAEIESNTYFVVKLYCLNDERV